MKRAMHFFTLFASSRNEKIRKAWVEMKSKRVVKMNAMGLTLQVTVGSTSTPSTNTVHPGVNDMDWFAGVAEEELLYYTGVGNDVDSLWAVIGSFVPPPPRPPYLPEEGVTTDGLTTCDLCSWAWRNDRHSFSLDGTLGKWRHTRFLSFNFRKKLGRIFQPFRAFVCSEHARVKSKTYTEGVYINSGTNRASSTTGFN